MGRKWFADVHTFHGKHDQKTHGRKKGPPVGQVSFEAQPSTSLSPVPGIQEAGFSEKRAYMTDAVGAMGNPETGAPDELMEASGLDGEPPFEVVGVWKGEFNPGMQAEIDRDAKQEDVEAYAASVGKTLKQDAVGYHRPFYDGDQANDQGAEIELGETISKRQMGDLYGELGKEVGAENVDDIALVASKNGVRALNFSKLPPEEFQAKLGTAASKAIAKDVTVGTFDFEGGLVENDWKANPNGQGYDKKIGKGRSNLRGAVERVNARVGKVNEEWRNKLAVQTQTAASERRRARERFRFYRKRGIMAKEKTKPEGKEEDEDDEDEDGKKKKKPPALFDDDVPTTKLFFGKFLKALRSLLPEEDVKKAMKTARASAGGEMKKRKKSSDPMMVDKVPATHDDDYTPAFRPKKSKDVVMYGDSTTMGQACNSCRFYLGGACRLVEGTIMPDFVCELWEEKLNLFNDNVADLCAGSRSHSEIVLFNELMEFAEPPEWIPYLPKPGEYNSPKYGDIYITKERNENFIRNFEDGVYQESLPISSEHVDADQDGAYGWIEKMRMNEDGSVDAKVAWTDRGVEAISNDRFRYFSPEFHDVYKDNKEMVHKDVAVGGALTTRPFFKEDELRPLVASEGVLTFSEGKHSITFTSAAHIAAGRKKMDKSKGDSGKGTPKEPTTFEKFRDGLTNFIKTFNAEEDVKPEPVADPVVEPEPVVEPDPVLESSELKTASERIAKLETENRALKASEARNAQDSKKSSERIAALEDKGQRQVFREIVMGETSESRWFGETEKHIEHMMDLKKAFGEDSDQLKHYIATQDAQVAAMNTAGLFDERGSSFGLDVEGKESPLAELKKIAMEDEERKSGKLTFEQAFLKAGNDHPELKKKYREQFRSRETVK